MKSLAGHSPEPLQLTPSRQRLVDLPKRRPRRQASIQQIPYLLYTWNLADAKQTLHIVPPRPLLHILLPR